jgi:chorismate mutase
MSKVRGIRGAIRVPENTKEAVLSASAMLLKKIADENQLDPADITSILFTATSDLNAEFPAYAARKLGWTLVPLICAREIDVPDSMKGVVRVLVHVNTDKSQEQIKHQYLGETRAFRPDLYGGQDDDSRHEN